MSANQQASGSLSRDKVRAPRYRLTDNLYVSSKTIGTDLVFQMHTDNVSRSGLLLSWGQTRPIPFIENTILELTIDPTSMLLNRPVSCLGKVVRRKGSYPDGNLKLGITIVQIDNDDLDVWEACLGELSQMGVQIEQPEFDGVQIPKPVRRAS